MIATILRSAAACILGAVVVAAQGKPSFEVATIKRSAKLEDGGSAGFQPGGRFHSENIAVINLILSAYSTRERPLFPTQVIGAPEWVQSTRYDITAKVSAELAAKSPAELYALMPALMQSLLAERFQAVVHRDTRTLPTYRLVVARKDGALGPQMHRSTARCPDEREKCSLRFQVGHVTGGAMTMPALVSIISSNVERVVEDATGLTGIFYADLEWSPAQTAPDKPSIFAAVQEQLGLKLESTKGPVDVLVIDHVERLTPD